MVLYENKFNTFTGTKVFALILAKPYTIRGHVLTRVTGSIRWKQSL